MAKTKDPGDDFDWGDDDWDSELDNFDVGVDEFNFDETNSQTKDDRNPVSALASNIAGTAASAVKGIGSGTVSKIASGVENHIPGVAQVWNDVSGVADEVSTLKSDVTEKIGPLVNETKKASAKLLRQTTKLVPSFLSERMTKFINKLETDTEEAARLTEEQEHENKITGVLAEVFKTQSEQDLENRKQEQVDKIIDRRIDQKHHVENFNVMSDIRTSVLYQTAFTKTVFTAYLKKNLEIQYRHLFVSQDTLKLMSSMSKMQQERLDTIIKNTSLPEVDKINLSEAVGKTVRDKFLGSMSDKISNYLGNVRKNIMDNVVNPFIDAGSQAVSGLSMYADMQEMTGGYQSSDTLKGAGNLAGSTLGARIGNKLIGRALQAIPEDIRERAGDIIGTSKMEVIKFLNDFKEGNIDADWANNGAADFVRDTLLPSFNDDSAVQNIRYDRIDKSANLTNRTIETIEQIIPGYLSMMTSLLEQSVTGQLSPRKIWDFDKEDFVTTETAEKSLASKMFGTKEHRHDRLQFNADKTTYLLANKVDPKRREQLIADRKVIVKDIEKFKMNLALSEKLILLDSNPDSFANTTINSLERIANSPDVAKDEELFRVGFTDIEHPELLAQWLRSFFTNDKGEVNGVLVNQFNQLIVGLKDDVWLDARKAIFDTQNVTRQYSALKKYTTAISGGKRTLNLSAIRKEMLKDVSDADIDISKSVDKDTRDVDNLKDFVAANKAKEKKSKEANIVSRALDAVFGETDRKIDEYLDKSTEYLKNQYSDPVTQLSTKAREVLNKIDRRGTEARVYDKATDIGGDNIVGEAGKEAVVPLTDRNAAREGVSIIADEALTPEESSKIDEITGVNKGKTKRKSKRKHAAGGIWDTIKNVFTPIKTEFNKKMYEKYTTKDILIEQLKYLKEIADKPAIAVDVSQLPGFRKGLKQKVTGMFGHMFDLFKDTASLGVSALTGAVSTIASGAVGTIHSIGGVLFNKICDVYRKPENEGDPLGEPLVTEDDFKTGLYSHPTKRSMKYRIKSVDELTKPVYRNKSFDGVPAISRSDIRAGLVDKNGKPLTSLGRKVGRMFRSMISSGVTVGSAALGLITGARPFEKIGGLARGVASFTRGVFGLDVDVYSFLHPEECLISVKKLRRNLYMKKNSKGDFVLLRHISEIDGPVWCTDNPENGDAAGQMVLTEEDYANGEGLCDVRGNPLKNIARKLGNVVRNVTGFVGSGISTVLGWQGKLLVSTLKLGAKTLGYAFKKKDPYIDVYVYDDNNEKKLRLRGVKIREGAYFTLINGETEILTSAYGIKYPVYGYTKSGKAKQLISEEEIARGLYDSDGNKLTAFAGKSIAGKLTSIALAGAKGIGSFAAKALWKGAAAIGRGVGKALGIGLDAANVLTDALRRVLGGFKEIWLTRKDLEEVVGDRLLDIYGLLRDRLSPRAGDPNDKDGDGDRDGSYQDFQNKRKKNLEKIAEKEKKRKETKASRTGRIGTIAGTATSNSDNDSSLVSDIVTGNILSKGIDKITDKAKSGAKKAGGLIKSGASKAGGLITTGASKAGGLIASSAGPLLSKGASGLLKYGTAAAGSLLGTNAATAGTIIAGKAAGLGMSALSGIGTLGSMAATAGSALLGGLGTLSGAASAALAALGPVGLAAAGALAVGAAGYGVYKLLSDSDKTKKWCTARMKASGVDSKYDDEFVDFEDATWKLWSRGKSVPTDSDLIDFGKEVDLIKGSFLGFGGEDDNTLKNKLKFLQEWYKFTFAPVYALYLQTVKMIVTDRPEEAPDVDDIPDDIEPKAYEAFEKNLPNAKLQLSLEAYNKWAGNTEEKKTKKSTAEKAVAAGAITTTAAKALRDTTDKTKVTTEKKEESKPTFLGKLFSNAIKHPISSGLLGGIPGMLATSVTSELLGFLGDKLTGKKDQHTNFLTIRFYRYFGEREVEGGIFSGKNSKRLITLLEQYVAQWMDGDIGLQEISDLTVKYILDDYDLGKFKKAIEKPLQVHYHRRSNVDNEFDRSIKEFIAFWLRERVLKMAGLYISLLRKCIPGWTEKSKGVPDLVNISEDQRKVVEEAFDKGCTQFDTKNTRFNINNFIAFVTADWTDGEARNALMYSNDRAQRDIKTARVNTKTAKEKHENSIRETILANRGTDISYNEMTAKESASIKQSINTVTSSSFDAGLNAVSPVPKPKLGNQAKFGEKIWKHFKGKGWSDAGIAGMLGNLQKESGVEAVRKQAMTGTELRQDKDRSLSLKYATTADANPESFTNPRSVGFGLAQWTTKARKNALLDFAHGMGKSVGDEDAQIGFLDKELSEQYKPMVARMSKSDDYIASTADFLRTFERPADQSDREVADRAGFSKLWLEKFGGNDSSSKTTEGGESVGDAGAPEVNKEAVAENTEVKSTGADTPVTTTVAAAADKPVKTAAATSPKISTTVPNETMSPVISKGLETIDADKPVTTETVPVEQLQTKSTNTSVKMETVPVTTKTDTESNERQLSELKLSNELLREIKDILQKSNSAPTEAPSTAVKTEASSSNNEIVTAIDKNAAETRSALANLFEKYFTEATTPSQPAKAVVVKQPRKVDFPINVKKY